MGVCNGFQVLCEAGLTPGALLHNNERKFICKNVFIKSQNNRTLITSGLPSAALKIPIAHGEGNYYCDADTLKRLQNESRIVFRYSSEEGSTLEEFNPNGSVENIAGILNEQRNVLGMMPHPERATEDLLGSRDGRRIWESILAQTR